MEKLYRSIVDGHRLDKEEALRLVEEDLDQLLYYSDLLRQEFFKDSFSLCGIVSGKMGACSENCKFCAQSRLNKSPIDSYPLRNLDDLYSEIMRNYEEGIERTSVVTSGKKLGSKDLRELSKLYKRMSREGKALLCGSHGLLSYQEFLKLKEAGLTRYHNNLESSRSYFPNICSSHTYDQKLRAIRDAKKAGLEICSGGLIGMGETMEDRIDLALELRALEVKSIPINILSAIKGTEFENLEALEEEEILRSFAIFRFINPESYIRFAAGRGKWPDKGEKAFQSGVNAAISGHMLTISGISTDEDMRLLKKLNYSLKK